jgi:hypothetical protein
MYKINRMFHLLTCSLIILFVCEADIKIGEKKKIEMLTYHIKKKI